MESGHISEILKADDKTQRTIVDIIDVDSGESIDANDLIDNSDESQLSIMRETLSLARQSGNFKYVCAYCCQPVKLVGKKFEFKKRFSYYFSHLANSDECPVKTQNDESDPQVLIQQWLENFKSGELHNNLVKDISTILSFDSELEEISKNPILSNYDEDIHNKVDFSFNYKNQKIAIAFCVYNSFLNRLVYNNSFFREVSVYHLWIMPYFTKINKKMSEKDVFYSHHRNVFVFDKAEYYRDEKDNDISKPILPDELDYKYAYEESLNQGKLLLNCFWQTPYIEDGHLFVKWNHKLVGLEDLQFDDKDFCIYYHNSDKDFLDFATPENKAFLDEWQSAKEERWDKIFKRIKQRNEENEVRKRNEAAKELREQYLKALKEITNGERKIEKYKESDKWGFKSDDIIIIPPKYADAYDFEKGIAFVKQSRWGAIDLSGKKKLNFQYNNIVKVNDGFFIIENNNKLRGVITSDLKEILPCKYKTMDSYQGMVTMQHRPDGELLVKRFFLFGLGTDNNKSYSEDEASLLDRESNLWIIKKGEEKCVLRNDAVLIIPSGIYEKIKVFNSNLIFVSINYSLHEFFKIDGTFLFSINRNFEDISVDVDSKFIIGKSDGMFGAYEMSGNQLFEFKYDSIRYLNNYNWIVKQTDDDGESYSQIVNSQKKTSSEKLTINILECLGNIIIVEDIKDVKENSDSLDNTPQLYNKGLIDLNGTLIVPCMYDDFILVSDYLIKAIDSSDRFHLFTLEGKDIYPDGFLSISDCVENVLFVKKDDDSISYGVIGQKGSIILDCSHSKYSLESVDNGLYVACHDRLYVNPDYQVNQHNQHNSSIGKTFKGRCDKFTLNDKLTFVCDNMNRGVINLDNIYKSHLNKFDYICGNTIDVKLIGFENDGLIPVYEAVIKSNPVNYSLVKGHTYQGYVNSIYKNEIAIKVEGYGFVYCRYFNHASFKDYSDNTLSIRRGKLVKLNEDKELVSIIYDKDDDVMLSPLKENKVYPGIVTNKTDFGIFVRINHMKDGLLHISKIKKAGLTLDDFKIGMNVTVQIDKISTDKSKFNLSYVNTSFKIGETYDGTISYIAAYGLFVIVPQYGRGLVHSKQLQKFNKTISDYKEGEAIKIKVIDINENKKQISMTLSL